MKGVRIFDQATTSFNYIQIGIIVDLMLHWESLGRKAQPRPAWYAMLCLDEENTEYETAKYERQIIENWFVHGEDGDMHPNDLLVLIWDQLISGVQ